jgi:Tol biopolymer transport system component
VTGRWVAHHVTRTLAAATLLLATSGCLSAASSTSPAGVASGTPEPSLSGEPWVSEGQSIEPASGRIVFGRYDRFVGDFTVWLIDPNGTAESLLLPGGHECPTWSPDGKDIAMTPLGVYRNAGQPNGSYQTFSSPDATLSLGCSIWSADGSRLAFEGWDDTDTTRNGIYTLDSADGSDLQRITSGPDGGHDVPGAYSADGSQLFFTHWAGAESGPLMVVGADGSDPRQVTSDAYGVPSLSPDGTSLLAVRDGTLTVIALDGSSVTPIPITNGTWGMPSWSPDGSWVVFSLVTRSGSLAIARVHPDGSGLFQMTNNPANEEFPDWAP